MSTPASSSSASSAAAKSQLTLNLQDLLNDLFLVLTQKETEVIKRRFAIAGYSKQTLEKIGKHFNVTRERIRQIESIALSKLRRTVRTTRLNEVNEMAKGILKAHGGVMLSSELVSGVLKRLPGSSGVDGAILRLSFSIDSEMSSDGTSPTLKAFWRLSTVALEDITTIIDLGVKFLNKRHACMKSQELISSIQSMPAFEGRVPSSELIGSCLSIDERLREIERGLGSDRVALRPSSLHPRQSRDHPEEGRTPSPLYGDRQPHQGSRL